MTRMLLLGVGCLLLMEAPICSAESLVISTVTIPGNSASCVSLTERRDLLAFHSKRSGGAGQSDIWLSRREGNGWGEPVNAGPGVNTEFNEVDGRLSPDGSTLVFVRGGGEDMWKANSSRIHIARFEDGRWSAAEPLPSHVSPPDTIELGAVLSRHGRHLYFSSNRQGGHGRYDLYRSERTEAGWSTPVNLGAGVNSSEDEIDPALSRDGSAIVFPAHRSDSIGGSHDLYISRRVGRSWSRPVNLGPRINTPGNDTCPWLGHDGKTLYLNTDWSGLVAGGSGPRLVWRFEYSGGF